MEKRRGLSALYFKTDIFLNKICRKVYANFIINVIVGAIQNEIISKIEFECIAIEENQDRYIDSDCVLSEGVVKSPRSACLSEECTKKDKSAGILHI